MLVNKTQISMRLIHFCVRLVQATIIVKSLNYNYKVMHRLLWY